MKLAAWLLGKTPEYRVMIMGFDAVGKTTLLYQLKLPNEKITTIPTIGFNVETVESSKGHKFTFWDVGGCDKIRPLYRHYFPGTDAFLFVVDCSDTERFSQVVEEIQRILMDVSDEPGKKKLWVILNKQDLLPLEKRDEVVKGMRERLEKDLARCVRYGPVRIFGPTGFSAFEHSYASALLEEVADTMQGKEPAKPAVTEKSDTLHNVVSEADLKKRIEENVKENGTPSEEFWQNFLDADLPAFDHYNHLRAGYLVLLEGIACRNSVMNCADMFMSHLDMLRAKKPERFRNTTHRTMTIFWLFQLQVAAVRYAHFKNLIGLPSGDDFVPMLFHTPEIIDAGLWRKHYSKELMFSPKARASWVLPDMAPLPSITHPVERESTSEELLQEDKDLLIRFALTVIQSTSGTNLRRGEVIKNALSTLQTSIMQKRASMVNIEPYSETQAYFWIQFVHAALASLQSAPGNGLKGMAGWHGSMNTLTLAAFKALFDISGNEWQTYYSRPLWESMKARMGFVNPDKKPLPGLISIPPQSNTKGIKLQCMSKGGLGIATTQRMPPPESLAVMVAAVCDAAALSEADSMAGIVKTHSDLIVLLYDKLVASLSSRNELDGSLIAASKRRNDLVEAIDQALEVSGPSVEGLTRKMFWIQQVLAAAEQTAENSSFDHFMNSNPHLAYEGLPFMYYSEMILNSSEAKEVFIPPDRRPFPSVVAAGQRSST